MEMFNTLRSYLCSISFRIWLILKDNMCGVNKELSEPQNNCYNHQYMSIILSLEGSDGIVLAADSRETYPDGYFNDNSDRKLAQISDYIGLATSGDASLPVTLIEELKNAVEGNPL